MFENYKVYETTLAGRPLKLETGMMAQLANAAVMATYGETKVLSVTDGKITAARDRNMLACAFHPELSEDTTVHEYFLDMIRSANVK